MRLTNRNIWKAGAFDSMRDRLEVVSGPSSIRWRKLVGRVDSILRGTGRLIVVVAATGSDPTNPTYHDVTTAQLAALVVSKQWRYRLCGNRISAYLRYPPHTQVEVPVNLHEIAAKAKAYFSRARRPDSDDVVPIPMLAYLIARD